VLETLREHRIPIDCIAGASIGAVVGTLWAFGHPPDEIMTMVAATRRYLLKLTVPVHSLLSNRGIRKHIENSARGRSFEESPVPLGVVASDLHTGKRVLFRQGKIAPAVLASSSIPGVFPPVKHGHQLLVDGGVCEPVPAESAAELGADIVIAVNLGACSEPQVRPGFGVVGTLLRTTEILQAIAHAHTSVPADVVITPQLPAGSVNEQFEMAEQLRLAGRRATLAALPQLRRLLPWAAVV
jgi:NTE family protein